MDSSAKIESASNSQWRLESKALPSLRRLGRGLSGFVYETTWERRGLNTQVGRNMYVRKDIPLGSEKWNHSFETEVNPLFNLDHPNIVKCYGYTVGKSSCSLLQEYVDDSLDNTIQRRVEAQEKNSTGTSGWRVLDFDENKRVSSSGVKDRQSTRVRNEGSSEMPGTRSTIPLQMPEVVNIISQIAAGMKYLHDNEVVHGDLKPKNVLVRSKPDEMEGDEMEADEIDSGEMIVKVVDFGLVETKKRAKMGSKRTRQIEILMWKAPELLRELPVGFLTDDSNDPDADEDTRLNIGPGGLCSGDYEMKERMLEKERLKMADVYSFGLTCSHILGAKLLYPELSLTQLRTQRLGGFRPELPSDCPYYLEALIYSCLESEPSSRPTFSDICRALQGLQFEEPQLLDFLKDLYPVGTPMRYLVPSTECVERLQGMTTRLSTKSPKFNSEKCKHVVDKLNMAVQCALSYVELFPRCLEFPSPKHWKKGLEIFKLLLALAKQVESFVEGCCQLDARSLAAIILGNVSEQISSVCCDLELCTVVFSDSKNWGATRILTLTEAAAIIKAESEIIQGKASLDKETLLVDVKALIQSSKADSEEHQLATFLLQRLERPNSGYQSRVWKANYKDLKRERPELRRFSKCILEKAIWLGAPVAVRTFLELKHADLEGEVAVFAGLSHPNVVSLFCPVIDNPRGAIVVELMDQNLASFVVNYGPFTDLESVDLILQAAEGMLYLHENHIVHGNLNPANILVKSVKSKTLAIRYCHVKVDINVYYRHHRGYTWQSPRWMPPERIACQDEESPNLLLKSDVFSFGMVCYDILTRELPFSRFGSLEFAQVKKCILLGERPTIPYHCPQKLKQLIERCWDQDASTRPSFEHICAELRHLKCLLLTSKTYLTTLDGLNAPRLIRHQCCRASCPAAVYLAEEPKEKDRHCENCAVARVLRERAWIAEMNGDESNSSQKLLLIEPTDVELLEEIQEEKNGGKSISKVRWRTCTVVRKRINDLFNKQVDIAMEVWHPNIVHYVGYSYHARSSSEFPEYEDLFMELLDKDLGSFINEEARKGSERPFSFRSTLYVLLQVAEAVKYLHGRNIFHGALTPGNILMSCCSLLHSDAQLYIMKVAGSSASQFIDSSSPTGNFSVPSRRTLQAYLAPEVLKYRRFYFALEDPKHPKKIDVYSFGVVAYQVLTGVTKFYEDLKYEEIEAGVTLGQLRPDYNFIYSTLDDERSLLLPLIMSCWTSLPEDRPSFSQICVELQTLLSACKPEEPVEHEHEIQTGRSKGKEHAI